MIFPHKILVEVYPQPYLSKESYGVEVTFRHRSRNYLMISTYTRPFTPEELTEEYGENHPEPGSIITGTFPAIFSPSKPLSTVEEAETEAARIIERYQRPNTKYSVKTFVYTTKAEFYKQRRFRRR